MMNIAARVIAPVHITLSLPCGAQKRHNPSREVPTNLTGNLGVMSASTEDIALKILAALKAEHERAPTLLKCRPYDEILSEVAKQHQLASDDVRQADRYLKSNHLIKGVQRQDGFAALPSPEGINFLGDHQKTLKEEKKSKLKGRQKWYAIIISLLAVIVALLGSRSCSR